ncbi:MAG: damage-inducible protein CinA, partial [Pseudomonas sp.]|nr:damage-inducible protein CinA [Pseudomonas sp.]
VGNEVSAERRHFAGDRDEVRRQTVIAALEGLIRRTVREIENQG